MIKNLGAGMEWFHFNLKTLFLLSLFTGASSDCEAQSLPGFKSTGSFNEQELNIKDQWPNVQISINAPLYFNHTVQVEKNGYILSLVSGTRFDRKRYFTYFGERAYEKYIGD